MRVLFFLHPGMNSRDIFLDMAAGFRKAGAEVMYFELAPVWQAQHEAGNISAERRKARMQEITRVAAAAIQNNKIDVSIGMWANALTTFIGVSDDGKPCTLFDAINSPHLSFWLDAPHWAHEGALKDALPNALFNSPRVLHLINNEAIAKEMSAVLGFSNVFAQPYGVNETVFRPYSDVKVQFDIVFGLGAGDRPPTELMRHEIASDDPDAASIREAQAQTIRPRLEVIARSFDTSMQDSLIALFDRLIESQLRTRDVPMLDRLHSIVTADASLRPAIDCWLNRPAAFIGATAALREIENWERAFTISWLSHRFKCAVFGSPSLDAWDCRADRLGPLNYSDQSAAYCSGRIGLNVMRWQDDIGTNIKPFEITASGVPCLMSHRATLQQHFDLGRELLTFRSLNEAKSQASALIDDEAKRREIAEAGRARTLRDHTWTTRAHSLMRVFETCIASRKPAVAIAEQKPSPPQRLQTV